MQHLVFPCEDVPVPLQGGGDELPVPRLLLVEGLVDADVFDELRERCGGDEGWTRVLFVDAQGTAWTGYIWWSFLEKES